jgi:hypothetical protein
MPGVVVVLAKGLLARFVSDLLRLLLPAMAGLLILAVVAAQSLALDSMSSANARGEFYRPLLLTVAFRTALEPARDASGQPIVDEDGEIVLFPAPDDRPTDPTGMIPPAFLLAMADVLTGFNPLYACAAIPTAPQPPSDPTARRGLLAVDPLRFQSIPSPDAARARWRLVLAFVRLPPAEGPEPLPPTPEIQPPERLLCDAEVNAYAAAVLVGGYHWGAEQSVEGINGAYQALVDAYWQAMARYQADRRDWERCWRGQAEDIEAGQPPRACPDRPREPDRPVPPTPSCVQPELRMVERPTVPSTWDEEEMTGLDPSFVDRWMLGAGLLPVKRFVGGW